MRERNGKLQINIFLIGFYCYSTFVSINLVKNVYTIFRKSVLKTHSYALYIILEFNTHFKDRISHDLFVVHMLYDSPFYHFTLRPFSDKKYPRCFLLGKALQENRNKAKMQTWSFSICNMRRGKIYWLKIRIHTQEGDAVM